MASDDLHLVALLSDGAVVHRVPAGSTATVGSGPNVDMRVWQLGISRSHFAVRAAPVPLVRDLGSIEGTRVSGARIEPNLDTPIEPGAIIDAGGTLFMVHDCAPGSTVAVGEESDDPPASTRRFVAQSRMAQLHDQVGLIAQTSLPVVVAGETGVGKELVASALHSRSPRRHNPLVRINCAAVPETLLESELFGFERGAFTGATHTKPGLLESADASSFFLDEVGEMPLPTQAKLLRVLESGEILRVGALRPRRVDVRFIAATNRDLASLVRARQFRADLYYRLNGITLSIPPLRERTADIMRLAEEFLADGAKRFNRRPLRLSVEAGLILQRHSWPGNVRELRNVIDRALTFCAGDVVDADSILIDPENASRGTSRRDPSGPARGGAGDRRLPRRRLVRMDPQTERAIIRNVLDEVGGHQGRAAERLGVSRRTLINRLEEYGLARPRKRLQLP